MRERCSMVFVDWLIDWLTDWFSEKERDEYLRNACKIEPKFVIIELCETIQPIRIELANFELFSSGAKDVRVSTSERFDWLMIDW